jgi:hypothetical protein
VRAIWVIAYQILAMFNKIKGKWTKTLVKWRNFYLKLLELEGHLETGVSSSSLTDRWEKWNSERLWKWQDPVADSAVGVCALVLSPRTLRWFFLKEYEVHTLGVGIKSKENSPRWRTWRKQSVPNVLKSSVLTSIRCSCLLNGRGSRGFSGIFMSSSPENHRPAYVKNKNENH